jgi:Protein of unknown function (DUF2958)
MKLITEAQHTELLANGYAALAAARVDRAFDPTPVVKLFTRNGYARWLLTDLDPYNTDRAYGLCDLGDGLPDLGYVNLREIEGPQGKYRLYVECDPHFVADKPLSVYAELARKRGLIIT